MNLPGTRTQTQGSLPSVVNPQEQGANSVHMVIVIAPLGGRPLSHGAQISTTALPLNTNPMFGLPNYPHFMLMSHMTPLMWEALVMIKGLEITPDLTLILPLKKEIEMKPRGGTEQAENPIGIFKESTMEPQPLPWKESKPLRLKEDIAIK